MTAKKSEKTKTVGAVKGGNGKYQFKMAALKKMFLLAPAIQLRMAVSSKANGYWWVISTSRVAPARACTAISTSN